MLCVECLYVWSVVWCGECVCRVWSVYVLCGECGESVCVVWSVLCVECGVCVGPCV